MIPYYEDEAVIIYHGDCRNILPGLSADVAITDPPYGVGLVRKTSDYRNSRAFDAGESLKASRLYQDDPDYVRELVAEVMPLLLSRVSRALVFPGTRMLYAYPEPRAIGGVFTPNGAGHSPWGFQLVHPILYYGRDPFLEDGKGSRPNGFRTEQPNKERVDHPCPKPMSWMTWAVERASRPGETVLDPFAGSGTTLAAAKACGRKSIGIEIEERYCEIAAKRMGQEVLDFRGTGNSEPIDRLELYASIGGHVLEDSGSSMSDSAKGSE
jgi:site-specific DNA-methyltransferase (adenine-specific)